VAGKEKEKERDWDREMAEVDKLLSKLPEADPYLRGSAPAAPRPGAPGGGGSALVAPGVAAAGRLGTWARVGLGLLIGIGMTQWPYTHGCGLKLWFYLIGVGAVLVAGVWSSISSWRRRLGIAHLLSQGLVIWGLVLAAREVLPRVGYAKVAATWFCQDTPAPTPH
jgi:hypothetical protein